MQFIIGFEFIIFYHSFVPLRCAVIKHSDWLKIVTWLGTANQIYFGIAMLNLLMSLANGLVSADLFFQDILPMRSFFPNPWSISTSFPWRNGRKRWSCPRLDLLSSKAPKARNESCDRVTVMHKNRLLYPQWTDVPNTKTILDQIYRELRLVSCFRDYIGNTDYYYLLHPVTGITWQNQCNIVSKL